MLNRACKINVDIGHCRFKFNTLTFLGNSLGETVAPKFAYD